MTVLLSCCTAPPVSPPPSVSDRGDGFQELSVQFLEEQLSTLEILDYSEILMHSRDYDKKTVTVVGQIGNTDHPSYDFCFYERAADSFKVNLSSERLAAADSYAVNDYVIVQGIWNYDELLPSSYFSLDDAVVLADGSIAQQYYNQIQNNWYSTRKEFSQTAPLVHPMELTGNPEPYIGQLIRTAGEIETFKKNDYSRSLYFSFFSPKIDSDKLDINMCGAPEDMRQQCAEDEYVILSGILQERPISGYVLMDCFVECTGDDAEAAVKRLVEEQYTLRNTQKETYILQCSQYTYDQIARYPNDYINLQAQVSGTVLTVSYDWDKVTLLLDTGDKNLMAVYYTGHYSRDPLILEGDHLTFWGTHQGQIYASDTQENNRHIPLFSALYCSITE